jgi:DNA-binding transcriptional MerR regulator/effector-binding domain-containing protein
MQDTLISAGQFAKLARTTKRTVLWYGERGILMPHTITESGYRMYQPRQILDFQIILLLRRLNFSLEEIEAHVKGGKSLMSLFAAKKDDIAREIHSLQRILCDTEAYYDNLTATNVLVRPETRAIPAFDIYYLDKTGPYAKISDYCNELLSRFDSLPDHPVLLTIFEEGIYKPHKAKMKIGIIKQEGLQLRYDVGDVREKAIPTYKALTYIHHGPGTLLSLLWQELAKYRRKNKLKPAKHLDFADLELYVHTGVNGTPNPDEMEFELHLPVSS